MKEPVRQAFVFKLLPGMEEEYAKRHNPVWKELADVFSEHGVISYSIYHHPATDQLFGYAELESLERWADIASTDVCRRWWNYMSDTLEYNPDGSPKAVELKEVFHLDKGSM